MVFQNCLLEGITVCIPHKCPLFFGWRLNHQTVDAACFRYTCACSFSPIPNVDARIRKLRPDCHWVSADMAGKESKSTQPVKLLVATRLPFALIVCHGKWPMKVDDFPFLNMARHCFHGSSPEGSAMRNEVQQSFDQLRVHLDPEAVQDAFMMVTRPVWQIDMAILYQRTNRYCKSL